MEWLQWFLFKIRILVQELLKLLSPLYIDGRAVFKKCCFILAPQKDSSFCAWLVDSFGCAEEIVHVMAVNKLLNLSCFVIPPLVLLLNFLLRLGFDVVKNVFLLIWK